MKIIIYPAQLRCQAPFLLFLFTLGFSLPSLGEPHIRLAVKQGLSSITLKGRDITVRDYYSYRKLLKAENAVSVKTSGSGLTINGKFYRGLSGILLTSRFPMKVDGLTYSGRIEIVREGRLLTVVNDLPLEDYVAGVVSREMSPSWPIEALKAQAVCARTYALHKMIQSRKKIYDMVTDIRDQVYHGMGFANSHVKKAVMSTRGEVLTYQGKVAQIFYHSTCGGKTEDPIYVWGFSQPYLKSVRCGFDSESPYYFWKYKMKPQELRKKLIFTGRDPGKIKRIIIAGRTPSGRVKRIKIVGSKRTVPLTGEELRRLVGYSKLKSTRFTMDVEGGYIVVRGSGAGHGVGLCQWGAKGMAEKGYNYRQILKHYFPGIKISNYKAFFK